MSEGGEGVHVHVYYMYMCMSVCVCGIGYVCSVHVQVYNNNSYAGGYLGRSPRGGKSNSEDSLGGRAYREQYLISKG